MGDLNLARRPFLNLRPVRRAGLLLLIAGAALTITNGYLYWKHFTGEGRTRSRSQDLAREATSERESIRRLESEIVAIDIDELNDRARFVNAEIDRRRFGWSRLFDRIAEVLPEDVRLVSLLPRFRDERGAGNRTRRVEDRVALEIRGVAKSGEAILALIDALFDHPAFSEPDLAREATRQGGVLEFALGVVYLPDASDGSAESRGEDDRGGPTAEGDGGRAAADGVEAEGEA